MADVAADLKTWSTTTGSNSPADATTVGAGLADNLQEIQAVIRRDLAHKGADIASATTTDIGAVQGYMHDITGTTTITGLGTVSEGITKVLQFDGALTLTHNASSLILPGGANITTAAGDTATFISLGSGNWTCLHYTKKAGVAVIPTYGEILVDTDTAASSSSLIVSNTTYDRYILRLQNIVPTTDGVSLYLQYSDTGETGWLTDSTYLWSRGQTASNSATAQASASVTSDTQIIIANSLSNVSGEGLDADIFLNRLAPSTAFWTAGWMTSSSVSAQTVGSGNRAGTTVTAWRIIPSGGGTIASGSMRLYGIRKT